MQFDARQFGAKHFGMRHFLRRVVVAVPRPTAETGGGYAGPYYGDGGRLARIRRDDDELILILAAWLGVAER